MKTHAYWIVPLLVLLAGGLASGEPPVIVKHSGTVVTVDSARSVFVLAEVGPWRVDAGRTVITERRIALTESTEVTYVRRDDAEAFPGDFLETRLGARELMTGDFVTVECRHEGQRLVAVKVTVCETE